jgi:nucleotide-binding universal stress UspA family protein
VLLLKVVSKRSSGSEELAAEIGRANEVLSSAIQSSIGVSSTPAEALLTISDNPWREISRVAKHHNCHGLVLGVNRIDIASTQPLLNQVEGDIALLTAPLDWHVENVRRVLVPVGGKAYHDPLRARVLGTLLRTGLDEVCFLSVLSPLVSPSQLRETEKMLAQHAQDEAGGVGNSQVLRSELPIESIVSTAEKYDLLILGLSRSKQGEIRFGDIISTVARDAQCATLIIGRRSS